MNVAYDFNLTVYFLNNEFLPMVKMPIFYFAFFLAVRLNFVLQSKSLTNINEGYCPSLLIYISMSSKSN